MHNTTRTFLASCSLAILAGPLHAEIQLPSIIGDHMVLQQKHANPIWGWDHPGTPVTVTFGTQSKSAKADSDGRWSVKLDPLPANPQPQTLQISTPSQKLEVQDVLIGEVWMCSGQSNMEWPLSSDWNGDLEAKVSHYPNIRLITVPKMGTQETQKNFKGNWVSATPETTPDFSAVGYLFGRYVHQATGVPVGLIDNAWGASAAEAWVRRATLEKDPRFATLMQSTRDKETHAQSEKARADYEAARERYKADAAKAKSEGKPVPRPPQDPASWLASQFRPGNIFEGMLQPTLGYGLKGVVWYQGESNASRAAEYRDLFPTMIQEWRKEWQQPELSFYWVQLADFRKEEANPGESDWAELREAQTKTLSLPNTGQAVIIDLGEGKDIHPKNKHDVAARLARWALAKDYGIAIPYRSPEFKSMEIQDGKITLTMDCFGSKLRAFDVDEARGFAVCGEDRVWQWAKGKVMGTDKVELTCAEVPKPVAVRYAWANNPVCNITSLEGLPLTPFRTDDFELTTKPKVPAAK
ncbi:MAG: hypothetical protein RLZZ399_797 [Verrucomicrobiota bacterium]|jgi:sialate O-acetylesterase